MNITETNPNIGNEVNIIPLSPPPTLPSDAIDCVASERLSKLAADLEKRGEGVPENLKFTIMTLKSQEETERDLQAQAENLRRQIEEARNRLQSMTLKTSIIEMKVETELNSEDLDELINSEDLNELDDEDLEGNEFEDEFNEEFQSLTSITQSNNPQKSKTVLPSNSIGQSFMSDGSFMLVNTERCNAVNKENLSSVIPSSQGSPAQSPKNVENSNIVSAFFKFFQK